MEIVIACIIVGFTVCCGIVSIVFCIIFTKTFDQQLRLSEIVLPPIYEDSDIAALELQVSKLEKLVKVNYLEYKLHKHAILKRGKV